MNGLQRLRGIALLIGLFLLLLPQEVHAYLDPGTGSLILQALLAAFFASLMTVKIYWKKIKQVLSARFSKSQEPKESHD